MSIEEELEPTKGQGHGGCGGHPTHPVPSAVGYAEEFFNIFNEKYGHILFYWQPRDQPCLNALLCASIYVFNHSSFEVDNAQFCHCFHDCSPEILLHTRQLII